MSDKPWNDTKELARLYYTLHEDRTATYGEIADELGCSTSTISLRFNNPERWDIIKEMSKHDFNLGKHEKELVKLSNEEITNRIQNYLGMHWEPTTVEDGVIVAENLLLGVVVSDSVVEGIDAAYSTGKLNSMVAISEHKYSSEVQNRFDNEAVGLLVVGDDIHFKSDCNLMPDSGVEFIFVGEDRGGIAYQNKAWMNYQVKFAERTQRELQDMCSLLPHSTEHHLKRFDLA